MYDPSAKDKQQWLSLLPNKPDAPLTEPLEVTMQFAFPRPKSHYRSGKYATIMRDSAPRHMDKTPDIDNLVKFYLDAMNTVFYEDDRQVISLHCKKLYVDQCDDPGWVHIILREVEEGRDDSSHGSELTHELNHDPTLVDLATLP